MSMQDGDAERGDRRDGAGGRGHGARAGVGMDGDGAVADGVRVGRELRRGQERAGRRFDPLAFNALRFVIASVLVFAVLRARGELGLPDRRDLPRIVALGLLGNVLYQMCFILGLDRTRAGHASVILALTPIMTAFLSMLTGHERPGPRTWGGAALSILGIAPGERRGHPPGGARGAGGRRHPGDGVRGVGAVHGGRAAHRAPLRGRAHDGVDPVDRRAGADRGRNAGAAAAGLGGLGAAAWGGLVFSATFAIGLAYLIWYRGVERIGNTRTAIFSNLTPIVALAASAVLLREAAIRPGAAGRRAHARRRDDRADGPRVGWLTAVRKYESTKVRKCERIQRVLRVCSPPPA